MPELLTWLDRCELRIVSADGLSSGKDAALVERVEKALEGLQQLDDVAAELTNRDRELAQALLALATKALRDMCEAT